MKSTILALFVSGISLLGCSDGGTMGTGPDTTVPQSFPACTAAPVFTEPNPNYVWTPNAIRLISKKVAPNVFIVMDSNSESYAPMGTPLATSGGFVIGEDGVLLVESMINRQLFCQVVALVKEQTDKPITHVINTSSHGDHSFGNTFLPSGVHIVQHERTAAYIAAHFAEDITFMETNFGADQGIAENKPVTADILVKDDAPFAVDLGGITVEARYHGFAQTGGDLFVTVPNAKVTWTGNAIVAERPAVPWLLDGHAMETAMTLADVKASLPADAMVVPGHGRPMTVNGLDFAVDYLNTMIDEVDVAVNQGLSEEQTVSQVVMPSYQGYKIWDWVHKVVNVPHTYQELKP
jgi:cyclase